MSKTDAASPGFSDPKSAGEVPAVLAVIAGNGQYPFDIIRGARKCGVPRIVAAAFKENTRPELDKEVDEIEWMSVEKLGALLKFLKKTGATHAIMAGQIHPGHIYNLRPDLAAARLLMRLKSMNAETIFGGIADEIEKQGCKVLPAYRFVEDQLVSSGLIAGPAPKRRELDDAFYGFGVAKEVSRLDIGQTVVVYKGNIIAVEAREGTNETLSRGGRLCGGKGIAAKVSKTGQDFRFDIPVVGPLTLQTAIDAGIRLLALDAGKAIIVEAARTKAMAIEHRVTLYGITDEEYARHSPRIAQSPREKKLSASQ
ncbi:MAG: UDP-2,3-diacylglucosamine diphosphatase LpxI [Chthoniobacter sp.]|nr:UDP-2,3-diacylglucosamine diphosphatase LpxI [Chthoniobacter sp.]